MGRRRPGAAFAPSACVFPGGSLDPADAEAGSASPLRPEVLALMTGICDARLARALAVAAVRETFEETGLMLGAAGDVGAVPGATWASLRRLAVAPALDRLDYLGRALTPVWSPIRFHARFFVCWADRSMGALGGDGELTDLGFLPLNEAEQLPVIDVTAFMLAETRRLFLPGGDPAQKRRFFSYGAEGPIVHDD